MAATDAKTDPRCGKQALENLAEHMATGPPRSFADHLEHIYPVGRNWGKFLPTTHR